jgi:hypothetical protein
MSLSEETEVVYAAPTLERRQSRRVSWHSCCFAMDKAFVMYTVQSVIGIGLLVFCSYQLSTEPDCDKAAPFWGLIGTICGFFFNQVTNGERRPGGGVQA